MTTLERLKESLFKFVTEELDQYESIKMNTKYGPVYITISREILAGHESFYEDWTPQEIPK